MLTAALDTSAQTAAFVVADIENPQPIIILEGIPTGRATSALFGSILDALSTAGIELNSIMQWTIGMGPGSFTGIRIGAALVKGVCAASGAAYRGVPTSFSMAVAAGEMMSEIAVLHDGRRDEVLVSLYGLQDGRWRAKETPYACPINELAQLPSKRLVMLATDKALERVKEVEEDRLFILPNSPVKHLLDHPDWPSPADQESSMKPVYVRPAVFVEPAKNTVP